MILLIGRISIKCYPFFLYKYKKGVTILDYSNQFYPDSLYIDSDHLNGLGADIFTQQLVNDLANLRSE